MTANIITITAGGNDLLQANRTFMYTYDPSVFDEVTVEFYQNMASILSEIHYLKSLHPTPYMIRLIGLYNPFPHLSYSDFWVQRFNNILLSFRDERTQFVDIYSYFIYGGEHLFNFGRLHPNKYGYEVIAEATASCGFEPLKQEIESNQNENSTAELSRGVFLRLTRTIVTVFSFSLVIENLNFWLFFLFFVYF